MSTDLFGAEHADARGFGGIESSVGGTDEWLTPRHVIDTLGPFDLDPCAPITRPWPTAARHYTLKDDGLRQQWEGRVWCNPPYAHIAKWMARMAEHEHGTALLFARTETSAWHEHVWPNASALLFLKGRLRFCRVNGKPAGPAGAPSVLIAFGASDADVLWRSALALNGAYVDLRRAA